MLSETSEKHEKKCFERYSPVILRILMYGAVDKIKLGKTLFPNWRHNLSQKKKIFTVKKIPTVLR